MSRYTVEVPESSEIEVKRYLIHNSSNAEWYTDWVTGQGYVTRIIFDNLEEAIEFQLKFCDNIDYSVL